MPPTVSDNTGLARFAAACTLLLALLFTAPAAAQSRRGNALANVSPADAAASREEPAPPIERVTFTADGKQQTVAGRILIEAADGGMLLQSDDGALWTIQGSQVLNRKRMDAPFKPVSAEELGQRLLAELPDGFRVHTTPHYVVCYDTSRQYAEWTSSLFERLYKAFTNYWQRQGLELHEPEFPLPIVIFADARTYDQASRADMPGGTGVLSGTGRGIVGFYSLRSNRVNMFDLTGTEVLRDSRNRRGSLREINQMLSQRAAVPLVATIVHEATHQIAFNCGLQTRFADIPLWQCEGMAMVFEAPDLASSRGWRGIGRVNYPRLETFHRNLPNWRVGMLEAMLVDNSRLRDPRTAAAAYADAWALNYYLIKYRPDDYAAYMKVLAAKPPLQEDDRATRLAEFRQHFGDIADLESAFLKQMSRVE